MEEDYLKVSNVCRIFPDGTHALQNISFEIKKGEFSVIGGRNGSGKSVLMSLIAGLDAPSSGEISAPEAGLIFQNADVQILGQTPTEDILFGLKNLGFSKKECTERLERTLLSCGLEKKKDCTARLLSGGEKRRLAVAGILAMDRDFIIFDEPFANLDFPGVKQVCGILKELKEKGYTVIVLTHELEKILALADRFIILDDGKKVFDGSVKKGLEQDLSVWGIRNPLQAYSCISDLFWG